MKTCIDCGNSGALSDFYYSSRRCKPCHNLKSIQWAKANPDKVRIIRRRTNLKEKYGLSVEAYNEMFSLQKGLCALCGKEHSRRPLNVDHNHTTGKIRGLLCDKCNLGIGLFDDNPDLLEKVKGYLS